MCGLAPGRGKRKTESVLRQCIDSLLRPEVSAAASAPGGPTASMTWSPSPSVCSGRRRLRPRSPSGADPAGRLAAQWDSSSCSILSAICFFMDSTALPWLTSVRSSFALRDIGRIAEHAPCLWELASHFVLEHRDPLGVHLLELRALLLELLLELGLPCVPFGIGPPGSAAEPTWFVTRRCCEAAASSLQRTTSAAPA